MDFWRNKKLKPEVKNEMLISTCRKVFNTHDGKVVLNMLLTDLCYFKNTNSQGESSLNNYAKFFIRERLGLCDTKSLTDFIAETAGSGRS